MNRLLDIGYQVAGHWYLADSRIRIDVRQHGTQRNVLYAFVCDSEVKYVGKSTQTLRERMAGYASPGSAIRTNLRVNRLIHALLLDEVTVEVFALPDNGLMHYGPFHLNLAAGIEDSIIRTLRPKWNVAFGRKRKREFGRPMACGDALDAEEALLGKEDTTVEERAVVASLEESAPLKGAPSPVVGEFRFVLQPTYRQNGFSTVVWLHQRCSGRTATPLRCSSPTSLNRSPVLSTAHQTATARRGSLVAPNSRGGSRHCPKAVRCTSTCIPLHPYA